MSLPFNNEILANLNMALPVLPPPDLVVWDMDGTLTETRAANFVHSGMQGLALSVITASKNAYTAIKDLKNAVIPEFHIDRDTKRALLSVFAKLRQDTIETIEFLHNQPDLKQALVSNNSRNAIGQNLLDLAEIERYFACTLFREDMDGHKKPDIEVLDILKNYLSIGAKSICIWKIGDSKSDMLWASGLNSRIGITAVPIAIGTKSNAAAWLRQNPQKHSTIIENPKDICALHRNSLAHCAVRNELDGHDL